MAKSLLKQVAIHAGGDESNHGNGQVPVPVSPVSQVADELDADIYLISGGIDRDEADWLMDAYGTAQGRSNCALILTTYGGDADAAFVIARFLKRAYKRCTLYVFGHCKSAGTLIALGADEIVMSIRGELGPLDVQLIKEDELGRRNSGLDVLQSLHVINNYAFDAFEAHFLQILARGGGVVTTKTAAEIATSLASQLYSPISGQIDPLKLGEVQRAINIATHYGERLGAATDTIMKLVLGYPSHGFVIDLDEAKSLFPYVRAPKESELLMELVLRERLLHEYEADCIYTPHGSGVHGCLTPKAAKKEGDRGDAPEEADDGLYEGDDVIRADAEAAVQTGAGDGQGHQSDDDPALQDQKGRKKGHHARAQAD